MKFKNIVVTGAAILTGAQANAQMLSNPTLKSAAGANHVGASFAVSSLDYTAEGIGELEVERKIIGFELSTGLNGYLDGFVQAGITTSGTAAIQEKKGVETLGGASGLMLGVGTRGVVFRDESGFASVFGLLNFTQDTFEGKIRSSEEAVDIKTDLTDIHLGALYNLDYAPDLKPYAGIEVIFASEGKVRTSRELGNLSQDLERENDLSLRFGANIDLDKSVLRPEVILLGERTVSISATMLY